jgi:hypothetical protein
MSGRDKTGRLALVLAMAGLVTGLAMTPVNLFAQAPQTYPQQPQYGQQGPEPQEENPDDPSRGVARISLLQGDSNVRRGDSGELVAAAINAPLLAQDHIITAPGARAEVEFDSANLVRLAPNTDLALADLAYHKFQIQLAQGTIIYSVVRQSKSTTEIDTPSISIRPLSLGEYRISILGDGSTQVTVRAGQAEIYSPQGSEQLAAGRTMIVRSSNQGPEFQASSAIPFDDFDQWNIARDQQMQRSLSVRYVSSDINGADDLDQYGHWVPSQYGQAWTPSNVSSDWAPYRDGQWTWADYYGWTWVDSAPWGWAPYHYGRWFMNGSYGWSWFPGPVAASYYWRPALVGFFGFGAGFGFGFGFGFGNIGWCPLAPYEAFHPWYGHGYYGGYGHGYYNNSHIVNNTNIANTYRNARVNNGVSYASANRFGQGRQTYMAAHSNQLTQAGLVRGQVPLAPTRQSLNFTGHNATTNAMPAARGNQQFFMHQQPNASPRVPFSTQASHLTEASHRTLVSQQDRGFTPVTGGQSLQSGGQQGFRRADGGVPNSSNPVYGNGNRQTLGNNTSPSPNSGGWHGFGQPSGPRQTDTLQRSSGASGQSVDGWHSFGAPTHMQSYSGSGNVGSPYQPRTSKVAPNNGSNFNQGFQSSGGAQPIRVNPPVVRQRENYSSPGYGYSAPSYNSSAPRYNSNNSAPTRNYSNNTPRNTYVAPHYNAPPSSNGGSHAGGGSSSHTSSGGGSHPSSGGGSHSSGSHGSHH